MAFVFREERKSQVKNKNIFVGPGSYNFEVERENKIPKAYVPFGSMQPKSKDPKYLNDLTPGVGTYNLQPQQNGQKIVVSSQTQDIKILEISRPHPVFKSGTDRFPKVPEEIVTPGPGTYDIRKSQINNRNKIYTTSTLAKPQIIQHLISINKYQSIPSIPSNLHAYGYSENEKNQLELNQPPIDIFKGENEDKVGPGHYNVGIQPNKPRGISWSQSKAKKIEQQKPNTNLGPGSYEIKTVQPLYNYKQSPQFASKTLRTMDQRKGAISNKVEAKLSNYNQVEIQQSRISSEKAAVSTNIDDSDDQYEYIEDTTPGPGSYLEVYQPQKIKPIKVKKNFGVNAKRFDNIQKNTNIGPGSYEVVKEGSFKKKNNKKNQPVLIGNIDRFPGIYDKKKIQEPGPGSYEPRNTMEDKLIYKIQRGYRGQFGSTQGRFKQIQEQQKLGPCHYDVNQQPTQKQVVSVFKSQTKRKFIEERGNLPAPGSYNLHQYDISTKIIKEQQQDPDLVINKPGFGVGQARFKQPTKKEDDFDDDDIIREIQEKNRQEKKRKMLKNSSVFKSNQARFKQGKKEVPGPGSYYDGEEDYWNKRTYNILFADI